MPSIEGIRFDATSHQLVSDLIGRLKLKGDFAVYRLNNSRLPNGELRLAHHGRDPQHTRGRGVFLLIRPSLSGTHLIRMKNTAGGAHRTKLTADNLDEMLQHILSWRDQVKPRRKVSEKVDPNKPGTVQGGLVERNRRKH